MSRLSNLTTIKIGIFKSWNAYWFDKVHYASLLFNDLKIRDYITGLFYRLKIISDYIYLYRFF
jgi:ribosomal protein S3